MYVRFNYDTDGVITSINSPSREVVKSDSEPFYIEVDSKEQGWDIFYNVEDFKVENNVLTNGSVSFEIYAPERIKEKVYLVDEQGYYVDGIHLYEEELTERTIKTPPNHTLDRIARWDFEAKQWTYEPRPKNREELLEEENEKLKKRNQMSESATLELAATISNLLGGK